MIKQFVGLHVCIFDMYNFLVPVAHNIYGIPHTINTANYVYFLGLQKCLTLDHPDATKVFTGWNSHTVLLYFSYGCYSIYNM